MKRKPSSVVVEWRRAEPARRRRAMKAEVRRISKELVRRGASLVVLFGSRARGEAGPYSDADLLAVLPLPENRTPMARLADLYAEIAPRGVDLFAYTPSEFEHMLETSSFVQAAMREGLVLYGS